MVWVLQEGFVRKNCTTGLFLEVNSFTAKTIQFYADVFANNTRQNITPKKLSLALFRKLVLCDAAGGATALKRQ